MVQAPNTPRRGRPPGSGRTPWQPPSRTQEPPLPAPPSPGYQDDAPLDPIVMEFEQRQMAEGEALRDELAARDRIDAKQYGVNETVWKTADTRTRNAIVGAWLQRTNAWGAAGDNGIITSTVDLGRITDMQDTTQFSGNLYERAVQALEQDANEARKYTILCRPVIKHKRFGLIHQPPGVVKINRREAAMKVAVQGFHWNPVAGFMPDGTVECEFCAAAGNPEPFLGYPDERNPNRSQDLINHQKARHPSEWAAAHDAVEQETQFGQTELLRQLVADRQESRQLFTLLAERLTGAPLVKPNGDPIPSAGG